MNEQFVLKKEVDWSVLHQGFAIPVSIQVTFKKTLQNEMPKGVTKDIKLLLNGRMFKAKLINQKFDETKYPNHKDIVQIRYNTQSELAIELRKTFFDIYNYLLNSKLENNLGESKKNLLNISTGQKQFIVIYTTQYSDTFLIDIIANKDKKLIKDQLNHISEDDFEFYSNYYKEDENATIEEKLQLSKIRKLDRSICENLKLLYNNCCQVTGEKLGVDYNTEISEAHHLIYFTKSLNNNSDNIIILSPNYHRLVHKTNPVFERNNLSFIFPNGFKERLKLNYHL